MRLHLIRRLLVACLVGAAGLAALPTVARAVNWEVTKCEVVQRQYDVQFNVEACDRDNVGGGVQLGLYLHSETQPDLATGRDFQTLGSGGVCKTASFVQLYDPPLGPPWPTGKYKAWCWADPSGDVDASNNILGPSRWVVGPDLFIWQFWIEKENDTTKYNAWVCNDGTRVARNFRVGFYFNRSTRPQDGDFSDAFKSITELGPRYQGWFTSWALCKHVVYERKPTPDGFYTSWAKADESLVVDETHDDNNVAGPYIFGMANPDLVIEKFTATVSSAPPYRVTYDVRVCNRGAATARLFYLDVYYNRPTDDAPQLGQPGDQLPIGVPSLPPGTCVDHQFVRSDTPVGEYESWVQADADEFLFDPDRTTNLEGPLDLQVPGGVGAGCADNDGDGAFVGNKCPAGVPKDCNDNDSGISPLAKEICGDGIDQNCNETPDDGCPGVDCKDGDGDGWPVGPDCNKVDCDDADPARYPSAEEICGDGVDNDCDGIPDDCCPGSTCCDKDNDGYGVGTGCPGPQDCDDNNPAAGDRTAPEICGDNADNDCDGLIDEGCPGAFCDDEDGDGYGVGVGCTGQQDCDDTKAHINPAVSEVCGDGIDDNCDGVPDGGCSNTCVDTDNDGAYVGNGNDPNCRNQPKDCDDTNPDIKPNAPELCDGIDNNCNGTIDEGTPGNLCRDAACVAACAGDQTCVDACPEIQCVDADGDGWGVGPSCAAQDCDDTDRNISPGEREVCDGVDNDCDQTVDDGTPENPCRQWACVSGCAGNQTCIDACPIVDCLDHDGDGWGVGPDCVVEDPDDNDPAVYPGAPEICGDGRDQNNNGVIDDNCPFCVDQDGDGYGVGPYCAVRDCDDTNASVHPGASEQCGSGRDTNCDGVIPAKSVCADSCSCSAPGGSPIGRWPEAALLVLGLFWFVRRRRAA